MYQHQWHNGEIISLPVGKIVCIGRNYVAHAKELNNPVPDTPLLFIKPNTSLQPFSDTLTLPAHLGTHHYEAELALLVGETITANTPNPTHHLCGVGVAIDLTLRDLQSELKAKGHPWERAKAYDGSCPITGFYRLVQSDELQLEAYRFWLNGELKQHGQPEQMIFPVEQLLREITAFFTLLPGDVVLTGTPAGVGALQDQDLLQLQYGENNVLTAQVAIK
ncbi:fumarylacetoacetate hydrolase family protein [Pseudoalteromonas sp. T1lg65]|uniref:fumarylacetoacetate hydrolase family protein n=1 Tax=Pseudoalteromonas sp. T1lg65 TaxID=2077101 RepID=UPI003F78CF6B